MGTFSDLNYHRIWSTKGREPTITAAVEEEVFGYIRGKCSSMKVMVHALNGTEHHVHLACSIPPTISIADFLHKVKGSSGHDANQFLGASGSFWQPGYGALTFARRDLPRIVAYIKNQKQHHREGTLWPALEREVG